MLATRLHTVRLGLEPTLYANSTAENGMDPLVLRFPNLRTDKSVLG